MQPGTNLEESRLESFPEGPRVHILPSWACSTGSFKVRLRGPFRVPLRSPSWGSFKGKGFFMNSFHCPCKGLYRE